MGRPVYELSSCQRRKSSRETENERIRILLERQKEQFLAEVRTEIQKHEFQADSDGRTNQELMNNSDEINYLLLQEQLPEQNRDFREEGNLC